MKIYKVRAWVNVKKRGNISVESYHEAVFTKLEGAKEYYKEKRNRVSCDGQYGDRTWTIELFIPHIFENGSLAYWADNNKFIQKETSQ